MEKINNFLDYTFIFSNKIQLNVKALLFVIVALILASLALRLIRKLVSRKLPKEDKIKFVSIFSYLRWLIYLIILFTYIFTG